MFYFEIFVILVITVTYVSLLLWLYFGMQKMPNFKSLNSKPKSNFTIIIAMRNEAANLPRLLQSLSKLDYPVDLFGIIFVDDASTDNSKEIIKDFISKFPRLQIQLFSSIRKSNSPKKDAITTAIKQSKNEWIITTDADCEVPVHWLAYYDAFLVQNDAVFVAGPVTYSQQYGFLYHFQQLDWASLVGTTIGSFAWKKPIMCSGANLAYKKDIFNKVDGFQGNEHISSGDDVFLLQKMTKNYPNQVFFMNTQNAIVKTRALSTWKAVFQQRIRWAKKTGSIPNLFPKFVGISVFLMNILLVILLLACLFNSKWFLSFVFVFIFKFLVDILLLNKSMYILETKASIIHYMSASLLYPFFTTSIVLMSFFSNYTWKGRKFTK